MEMTAKDRKALFVLLGVAVVAVLLFVFVLHKGGSNTASPPSATGGTTSPQSQPSPATGTGSGSSESGSGGQHGPKPSPSPTQAARDPFTPLVSETPAVPSPAPSPPVSPAPSPSPSPSP